LIDRRTFLAGTGAVLLAAPLAAEAQPPGKVPRVGFLTAFSASDVPQWREGFRQGLRDFGYTEGRNIVIEYRYAEGRPERLPGLAAELVRLNVDIIAAETTPASLAVKHATATIPIVMTLVADPVESGLISSLGRPGGNITGLSLQLPDIAAKRLQLLREVVPGALGSAFSGTPPVQSPHHSSEQRRRRPRYWGFNLNLWGYEPPTISRGPSKAPSDGARALFSSWTTFSLPDI
jgi:putative tryptophan/tyrosine transport system substrate-binding protein